MTALLFPIGMFPWIMIVATLIFFPPDWPRRLWSAQSGHCRLTTRAEFTNVTDSSRTHGRRSCALYAAIQIAVPLRAYWPGADPEWTGRGFNFAWRVMLVEKAGHTELIAGDRATDGAGRYRMRDYVTERQEKMMAQDPFMVRALARHVAADLRARGIAGVEVRAESFAALNGRPVQRLIDPDVDLAAPALTEWIVPLARDYAGSGDRVEPDCYGVFEKRLLRKYRRGDKEETEHVDADRILRPRHDDRVSVEGR